MNLENNPWQCGAVFEGLLCRMHRELALSNNTAIQCQYGNGRWDIWSIEKRSSLCGPIKTPLKVEFLTVITADLSAVSVGFPLSPKTSPHTSLVLETAVTSETELGSQPENEKGGSINRQSWNKNTLMVNVILLITFIVALFVWLLAVKPFTKRCTVHHRKHNMPEEMYHVAALLHSTVPKLNPQLKVVKKNQLLRYVNGSSENVCHTEYRVNEEIC